MKVILFVISLTFVLSATQLHSQSSNSIYSESYVTLALSNYAIQRPADSYQSLRLRAISKAFTGLIQDNYTDNFLNPAFTINKSSNEIFADYASNSSGGKFLLGSSFNFNDQSLGAYLDIDKLSESSYNLSNSSYPPSSPQTSKSTFENLPRNYGAIVQYSLFNSQHTSFGLGYQFRQSDNLYNNGSENLSQYSSGSSIISTSGSNQNNDIKGMYHRFKFGFKHEYSLSQLSAVLTGLTSSYTLNNTRNGYYKYTYSNFYKYNSPIDISTVGIMLSVLYRTKMNDHVNRNVLLEAGFTRYDADGVSTGIDSNYSHSNKTEITDLRHGNGKIFDVKAGCSFDKNIADKGKAYIGLTLNYITNLLDLDEKYSTKYYGTNPPSKLTSAKYGSHERHSMEIIMPVGAEFFLGEIVTLRGGIEPSYRYTSVDSALTYTASTIYINDERVTKALSLTSNLGLGVHYEEFGELNILFSSLFNEMSKWSFSYRYFF